jgi:two-component system NtrC family response regulator
VTKPGNGRVLWEIRRLDGSSGRIIFSNNNGSSSILQVLVNEALPARFEGMWKEGPTDQIDEILGESPCMGKVFEAIRKVASADVPVLIRGESGTGKELVARAIHNRSQRRDGPFVAINCAAIPETLLESELFGHEKGSFSGAIQQRKGRTESADGGTLFLDEIGEMPPGPQVKLLRFLQDGMIERVGGREQIKLNVRVVAATNRDLKEAIAQGSFRKDLYYRLNVVDLHLPPLRERGQDILLLAWIFLKRISDRKHKKIQGFTPSAIGSLQAHSWPGNVRELMNKIRRAVVLSEGVYLTPKDLDLPRADNDQQEPVVSLKGKEQQQRIDMIVQAMAQYDGNISQISKILQISRPTLYRYLRKFRVPVNPYRTNS